MKTTQRLTPYLILALLMFAFTRPLMASDAIVEGDFSMLSPVNGVDLPTGNGDMLRYDAKLTPMGDHLQVYIDDQKPLIDKDVKGCPCAIALPTLSPGVHTIVVKEATKDDQLTGLQAKVSFKVE